MPTLERLISLGTSGELRSTIPPLTGPAWVSFATGVNPGRHGCYDFFLPKTALDRVRAITSEDINAETFYERLENEGRKNILVNLPGSDPPRIEGIVLSSFLAKSENYVSPSKCLEEIPILKKYRPIPENTVLLEKQNFTKSVIEFMNIERDKFDCA